MFLKKHSILFILLILFGCSGLEDSEKKTIRKMNAVGEYIYRNDGEKNYILKEPKRKIRENYRWEDTYIGTQIRITKESFRCKGEAKNPTILRDGKEKQIYLHDCGGANQHSLPLQNGKPYIYTALIDLLNYIQEKTKKKVMITSGHRCPTHNAYVDGSKYAQNSLHMIGAEVDFYVKGLEWSPEDVVKLLMNYYRDHSSFKIHSKFTEFKRFENAQDVTILPWYNKEIFVKLYKKDEGRDLDNAHKFPYISIQIRWDRDKDESVTYNWSKAFNNYLRY